MLKKGVILYYCVYDNFKSSLEGFVFKKGYFDGYWFYYCFEVYLNEYFVDWWLGYDSGDCYCYGEI